MGGLALDGKLSLKVPNNYPCYISLVNSRRNKVDFTLYGTAFNTSVFMMKINYPFNASNYTMVEFGKTYHIQKTDDITILYLGSLIDQNTTSLIEWKKIPEPLSAIRALANLAVIASALFIGFMI